MKKFRYLLLALILGAIAFILLRPQPKVPELVRVPEPASLRDTRYGPVVGSADTDDTYAWLGIPYAAAPTGDRRWRAPQPPEPWVVTRETLSYSQPCVQLWNGLAGVEGEPGEVVGAEDCLYLNIWAPRRIDRPLPVMVWIHGGGNTVGTGSSYPANRLAGGENVVVVTINYRLGFLGWLSHPALRRGDPLDDSGNYGTLDHIAALQWVRDNIASFGGDPGNVTVFGESAGARNAYVLMASPLAAGLFHRAISQSGALRTTPRWRAENFVDQEPPGQALSAKEWLASRLVNSGRAGSPGEAKTRLAAMDDSEVREFLYGLSGQEILRGIDALAGMYMATQQFRDGFVVPAESLYQVFSDPSRYNSVPLMTGTNHDEMKLFLALNPRWVERRFGLLPRARDPEAYERMSRYFSDGWRATAVDAPADIIASAGGAPVFAYRWDWDEGARGWLVDYATLLGAAHGLEIGFIFNDYEHGISVPGLYNADNIPGRDRLAAQMRSYWAEFARAGDPGRGQSGGLPRWQPWQAGSGPVMLLDTDADGGVRLSDEVLTVAMVKKRLRNDPAIAEPAARCTLYAQLFLRANFGDDVWDEAEYRDLGCEGFDPWELEAAN